MAISVLTSFSKDRAFDTAVTDAFGNIRFLPEPMAKLLLGFLLAGLAIPAWLHSIEVLAAL